MVKTTWSDENVQELTRILNHDNHELRAKMLDTFRDPLFKRDYYLGVKEHRKRVDQQLAAVLSKKFARVQDYQENPLRFFTYLETLMFVDYSLSIKHGVHWTLCGGTIQTLGTKKHTAWLDRMNTGQIVGCFAMTELGHGSNVAGIETTAVYDPKTKEFIINTPTESAQKCWIGGAASTSHISTIFAQLTVGGTQRGIHVFVARLRNDDGSVCKGIRIKDNGAKMGLNGVDNGRIWFDNYRVPLDSLLDRYCSVTPEGHYSSPIRDNNSRFGTMISGLVAGRVSIAAGGVFAAKIALNIAIRYGYHRKQFGAPNELPIITYTTHHRRLFPGLVTTIALHFYLGQCKDLYLQKSPESMKKIHLAVSGLKAWGTWNRVEVLHACRDSLGGQGVAAVNWIGPAIADYDVDTTFEGDNVILLQQISKSLLSEAMKARELPNLGEKPVISNLSDLKTLSLLLHYRRDLSLLCYVKKINSLKQSGQKANEAMNHSLHLALDCAWAKVEADVMDCFVDTIKKCSESLRNNLLPVLRLFILSLLEKHMAFYLQHGLLKGSQADQVADLINEIGRQMFTTGTALRIIDSLGVPEHMLPPVCFPDYIDRFAYPSKL